MQSIIAEQFIELKCAQLAKKQQQLQLRASVNKFSNNEAACSSGYSSVEPSAALTSSSALVNSESASASSNSARQRVASPVASMVIGAIGRAGERVGRITGDVLGSALAPISSADDDDEEEQLYESYRQAREAGAFDYSIAGFKRLLDEVFEQLVLHSARAIFKHASAYIEQRYGI